MTMTMNYCIIGGDNMGLFGGGNSGSQNSQQSASDALVEQQFAQNQAEIQAKKKNLYQQRLDIIHSQGKESWHPNKSVSSGVS